MSHNWYAVHTRRRWEKKVADTLSRKNIKNYCPLNKVVKQWSDRKKTVLEPLFISYVFVHISENQLASLKQVDGIMSLVYWLAKPAVIKDSEIEMIQRFLNEHSSVKSERVHVNVNDMVRIINGPLMDYEGRVVAVDKKTVKLILPSLGYMMRADIEATNVEVLTSKEELR